MIFNENRLLADDSHVISYCWQTILMKNHTLKKRRRRNMSQNLSSVAVAAAALCESNESPSLTFGWAEPSEHSCLHMQ